MTLDEMKAACAKGKYVYLTVIRENLPKGTKVRLTPNGGPLGRICNAKGTECWQIEITACWESAKVLDWLSKQEAKPA